MDLTYFPMDTQVCSLEIESCKLIHWNVTSNNELLHSLHIKPRPVHVHSSYSELHWSNIYSIYTHLHLYIYIYTCRKRQKKEYIYYICIIYNVLLIRLLSLMFELRELWSSKRILVALFVHVVRHPIAVRSYDRPSVFCVYLSVFSICLSVCASPSISHPFHSVSAVFMLD